MNGIAATRSPICPLAPCCRFGLDDWRVCLRVGADAAWATDRGEPIVQAMLAHLRANGVLLPSATAADRPLSDDWFEFERAIATLLGKHLGFAINHQAIRGKGDDGVDILATKDANGANELWLIQCKFYSKTNPVGPGVVREMLGAIADAICDESQIVRGMIVTTGRFTGDALRLAAKHGIQTTDGDDLSAICASINRRSLPGQIH